VHREPVEDQPAEAGTASKKVATAVELDAVPVEAQQAVDSPQSEGLDRSSDLDQGDDSLLDERWFTEGLAAESALAAGATAGDDLPVIYRYADDLDDATAFSRSSSKGLGLTIGALVVALSVSFAVVRFGNDVEQRERGLSEQEPVPVHVSSSATSSLSAGPASSGHGPSVP
jgi:hypothetical protein